MNRTQSPAASAARATTARRSGRPWRLPVERLEVRTLLSGGYAFNVVAAFGDPLPRAADGVFTGDFEAGGINDSGHVVFTSDQGKPNAASDKGRAVFFTDNDGGKPFHTLSLPDTPAPGGGSFSGLGGGSLSPDAINNAGDAAFAFTLPRSQPGRSTTPASTASPTTPAS